MKLMYFNLITLMSIVNSRSSSYSDANQSLATSEPDIGSTNETTNLTNTKAKDPCTDSGFCNDCPHACRYWTDCLLLGLYCTCVRDINGVSALGHCVDTVYDSGCC